LNIYLNTNSPNVFTKIEKKTNPIQFNDMVQEVQITKPLQFTPSYPKLSITLCMCDGVIKLSNYELKVFLDECKNIHDLFHDIPNSENIIEIPLYGEGITKDSMENIIEFMCYARIKSDAYNSVEKLESVFFTADYLGFDDLMDHIVLLLSNTIKQAVFYHNPKLNIKMEKLYNRLKFYEKTKHQSLYYKY